LSQAIDNFFDIQGHWVWAVNLLILAPVTSSLSINKLVQGETRTNQGNAMEPTGFESSLALKELSLIT